MANSGIQDVRPILFGSRRLNVSVSYCWCLHWDSNLVSSTSYTEMWFTKSKCEHQLRNPDISSYWVQNRMKCVLNSTASYPPNILNDFWCSPCTETVISNCFKPEWPFLLSTLHFNYWSSFLICMWMPISTCLFRPHEFKTEQFMSKIMR